MTVLLHLQDGPLVRSAEFRIGVGWETDPRRLSYTVRPADGDVVSWLEPIVQALAECANRAAAVEGQRVRL